MRPDVVQPPHLPSALRDLLRLDDQQFSALRASVRSARGFERGMERCEELARQLAHPELAPGDVFMLLYAGEWLYDRAREFGDAEQHPGAGETMERMLENMRLFEHITRDETESATLRERVRELASPIPELERRRKLTWLETGILDLAKSFRSFVELRPFFDSDRKRVAELVPVVICSVEVATEEGTDKTHIFQLTPEGVERLRQFVGDIEAKLSALRSDTLSDRIETTYFQRSKVSDV